MYFCIIYSICQLNFFSLSYKIISLPNYTFFFQFILFFSLLSSSALKSSHYHHRITTVSRLLAKSLSHSSLREVCGQHEQILPASSSYVLFHKRSNILKFVKFVQFITRGVDEPFHLEGPSSSLSIVTLWNNFDNSFIKFLTILWYTVKSYLQYFTLNQVLSDLTIIFSDYTVKFSWFFFPMLVLISNIKYLSISASPLHGSCLNNTLLYTGISFLLFFSNLALPYLAPCLSSPYFFLSQNE